MKKLIFIFFIICFVLFFFFNQKKENYDIKFASWGSQSETEIIKNLILDFEKQNNVKVQFIHIPENYFQKIHLLFSANLAPDVIFMNNQNINMYISADLLENLNEYFDKELNNFYPVALKSFSKNGKIYAIPRDISNLVLYVNKDILKENGILYKEKINSLKELQDIAQKLTTKDYFGINFEENSLYWLYFVAANGGGVISSDKKQVLLNSEKTIEAINMYSDFVNKYHIAPNISEIGSMTTAQMFINGKIAMYLGGRWMCPKFKETINFNWDIIEFPSSKENPVYVDSSGWAISKKSKKKELAVKLIKYLSSEQISEKFTQSGLIVPARIDVAQIYFKKSKNTIPQNEHIFVKMLDCATPTTVNENYNKINDILNEEVKNIFSGKEKAENVFNRKVIKEIESLL